MRLSKLDDLKVTDHVGKLLLGGVQNARPLPEITIDFQLMTGIVPADIEVREAAHHRGLISTKISQHKVPLGLVLEIHFEGAPPFRRRTMRRVSLVGDLACDVLLLQLLVSKRVKDFTQELGFLLYYLALFIHFGKVQDDQIFRLLVDGHTVQPRLDNRRVGNAFEHFWVWCRSCRSRRHGLRV